MTNTELLEFQNDFFDTFSDTKSLSTITISDSTSTISINVSNSLTITVKAFKNTLKPYSVAINGNINHESFLNREDLYHYLSTFFVQVADLFPEPDPESID